MSAIHRLVFKMAAMMSTVSYDVMMTVTGCVLRFPFIYLIYFRFLFNACRLQVTASVYAVVQTSVTNTTL